MSSSSLTDPGCLLPPVPGFKCGESSGVDLEEEEESDLRVTFHCQLPPTGIRLQFGCRKPSFGVLTEKEDCIEDFDASAVDPNFFDVGYTLAGSTGFCVWAGARFLVEAMALPHLHAGPEKSLDLPLSVRGARIIELGSGIGLVGTSLAWAGAEVLLTDLPSLVDHAIRPNLRRNANKNNEKPPPEWLVGKEVDNDESLIWSIGEGWASSTVLDMTRPCHEQLSAQQLQGIDLIVASDCVWLESMLKMLMDTVVDLFAQTSAKSMVMAFQRRDSNIGSATFTTEGRLTEAIVQQRGWKIRPLAWRPVTLVDKTETEVYLVEIRCDT